MFDNEVINKEFPWHPHATIYRQEKAVKQAEEEQHNILTFKGKNCWYPKGELFPIRMITETEFSR